MTVKLVTLKTDKTLLATISEDASLPGAVIVKEPVQVVMVPPRSQTDQGGIAFIPFLDFSEEFKTGIVISPNDILTVTTPLRELLNQYNTMFGSGIQIASSLK
jgi:hypothetical protein|tara:strand:- start:230 stop:538 length:309 start_codon:yes stop_codon:yes gene_type:complete